MEKSQHQIRFENLFYRSKGGWWNSYKFGSSGNLIHWVYVFSEMLNVAEQVIIGEKELTLNGKHFADVKLDEKLQMPIFSNIQWHKHFEENQKIYHEGLSKYKSFVRNVNMQYKELGFKNTCVKNKRTFLKDE